MAKILQGYRKKMANILILKCAKHKISRQLWEPNEPLF